MIKKAEEKARAVGDGNYHVLLIITDGAISDKQQARLLPRSLARSLPPSLPRSLARSLPACLPVCLPACLPSTLPPLFAFFAVPPSLHPAPPALPLSPSNLPPPLPLQLLFLCARSSAVVRVDGMQLAGRDAACVRHGRLFRHPLSSPSSPSLPASLLDRDAGKKRGGCVVVTEEMKAG